MKQIASTLAALMTMLLAGCMVGPKYARPSVPSPPTDQYKEADGWKTAQPSDQFQRGPWWEMFGDSQLNEQDLKVAQARFQEARAAVRFNRASQYPTISTAPGIVSLRDSANRPYFQHDQQHG